MLWKSQVPWNRAMLEILLLLPIFIGDAVIVMKATDCSGYSCPPHPWDDKIVDIAVKGERIILEIYLEPDYFLITFNEINDAKDLFHTIYSVLQNQQPQQI